MVTVTMRNGQRAEVANGSGVEAGIFPTETGANPAPALFVKTESGETVAVFRSSEVSWYGLGSTVTVA
jgi:hypothetical protein